MGSRQNYFRSILLASVVLLVSFHIATSSIAQIIGRTEQSRLPLAQGVLPQVAMKYKIPGMAVALIEHGRLRDIEVYGVRDKKSNAPITENTIFEVGQLSEPVFAYAALTLVVQGKLSLAAPLTKYMPLPYVRNVNPLGPLTPSTMDTLYDPAFNQISTLRVLNHTSGMPDWSYNEHLRLVFEPGERWSYSREAYLYLQNVIEHVTNKPTEAFLERSVLTTLAMRHSAFVWRPEFDPMVATGYDRAGNPVESKRYTNPMASTTLYATIREYTQFVGAMLVVAPEQRIHESVVSLMLQPTFTVDPQSSFSWGLGLGLEKSGDDLFFFHRENSPGFQCFVMGSRKTGNAVVIFTNSGSGLDAIPEILAATMGGNHPILKSAFLRSP